MLETIDINADLGEGSVNDAQLMPHISSCSIACGGHYGNQTTIRTAVKLAKKHGVRIGAHPSFPDMEHFGRKVLPLTKNALAKTIQEQLIRFYAVCKLENVPVNHIKLHGALYNEAAIHEATADGVLKGILAAKMYPKLYLPFDSVIAKHADGLFPIAYEAFIDRSYNDDLSLVSRSKRGAVIDSPMDAWQQLKGMLEDKVVKTKQDKTQSIVATTFCIHSDTPNVVETLVFIKQQLKQAGIGLTK